MKILLTLCVLTIFGLACSSPKRYDGYKVYRVHFKKEQYEQLRNIAYEMDGVDIWMFSVSKGIADLFTSPAAEIKLLTELSKNGFEVSVMNNNVQKLIESSNGE